MLRAADTAFIHKKNASLRFGGSPDCIYPWIAKIFHDHMEPNISKKHLCLPLHLKVQTEDAEYISDEFLRCIEDYR